MCPSSNLSTLNLSGYEKHHFADFWTRGHPVFFNTDDTGVFNQSITQEYLNMAKAFGLTPGDIQKILLDSAGCVFDESMIPQLKKSIKVYFEGLKK